MFEFEDKVDHVFTHWTSMDLVKVSSSLKPGILCLHLLHNLLAETAHFGRTLDRHVFRTLVSGQVKVKSSSSLGLGQLQLAMTVLV